MKVYPSTRAEYKEALLHDIYRLVQAVEVDDDSGDPEGLGRSIHFYAREFFSPERWKPRPVNESAKARIPAGEVLTVRLQHWIPEPGDHRPGYTFVTGRLLSISNVPFSREDGARFSLIPTGKRNPREYTYRVGYGTSLKVWKGKLTESQALASPPFYEHEYVAPIQEARTA